MHQPGFDPVERFSISCPHCGEELEITLEADVFGRLVQDCEVCCRPYEIRAERPHDDEPRQVWIEPVE